MKLVKSKKYIAFGAGKLLQIYLRDANFSPFSYCVDNFSKKKELEDLSIKKFETLRSETKGSFIVVIFSVSNNSLRQMTRQLESVGLCYKKDFFYYSDFLYDSFFEKVKKELGFTLDRRIYEFVLSFTINSRLAIHTTILGTWLFIGLMNFLDKKKGAIAEVGSFEGGNALASLQSIQKISEKNFYILDSFEGFPKLSKNDPSFFGKGDYNINVSFEEIRDIFSVFPSAILLKGFVPKTFKNIPKFERFSLVFYDCDLYQPALDTFTFFWPKIVPGGFLIIHDYITEDGGFTGVKKATDKFFGSKDVNIVSFPETTMAIIKKNK